MSNNRELLAIIPARAGSKGLPNKNIRMCAGKPLIVWTIEAALASPSIEKVLVSTDSEKIAAISCAAGAHVPFLRPPELATDDSSINSVIEHVCTSFPDNEIEQYSHIIVLQPTSPLRTTCHIEDAVKFYLKNKNTFTTLVSIYEAPTKSGWLMTQDESTRQIQFCLGDYDNLIQRQHLKKYYYPNGSIFILPISTETSNIYGKDTIGFVMSEEESIDIDTIDQFELAESILMSKTKTL